jgi:hypothetical protein
VEVREPHPEELDQLSRLPDGSLPPEWSSWADEPHRTLVVAHGGVVAAAIHLAVVGRGEGWVEGVRAGEDGEVQSRLVQAALSVLDGYGAATVRTALPVGASPPWLAQAGFGPAARFEVRLAPPQFSTVPRARPVASRGVGAACTRLESALTSRAAGLVPLGWRWRAFVREMATAAAREGRLLADDAGGVALFLRRGPDRLVAALVGDHPLDLLGCVQEEVQGTGRLVCFLAAASPEAQALSCWPAHPWCPEGVVVYQLTRVTGRR